MKVKLISLAAFVILIGILLLLGWVDNRREVDFDVILQPNEIKANGTDIATVHVVVTNKDGSPRAGDTLQVLRLKGHGQLRVTRIVTDDQGAASFIYYSYRESSFTPAMINQLLISDVSVGKIVGVYKRHIVDIPVAAAETDGDKGHDSKPGGGIQLGGGQ